MSKRKDEKKRSGKKKKKKKEVLSGTSSDEKSDTDSDEETPLTRKREQKSASKKKKKYSKKKSHADSSDDSSDSDDDKKSAKKKKKKKSKKKKKKDDSSSGGSDSDSEKKSAKKKKKKSKKKSSNSDDDQDDKVKLEVHVFGKRKPKFLYLKENSKNMAVLKAIAQKWYKGDIRWDTKKIKILVNGYQITKDCPFKKLGKMKLGKSLTDFPVVHVSVEKKKKKKKKKKKNDSNSDDSSGGDSGDDENQRKIEEIRRERKKKEKEKERIRKEKERKKRKKEKKRKKGSNSEEDVDEIDQNERVLKEIMKKKQKDTWSTPVKKNKRRKGKKKWSQRDSSSDDDDNNDKDYYDDDEDQALLAKLTGKGGRKGNNNRQVQRYNNNNNNNYGIKDDGEVSDDDPDLDNIVWDDRFDRDDSKIMTCLKRSVLCMKDFTKTLHKGKIDQCCIATFHTKYELIQGFSNDIRTINGTFDKILQRGWKGETRLYDSIIDICRYVKSNGRRNVLKIVVVITDGADNKSNSTWAETASILRTDYSSETFHIYLLGVGKKVNHSVLKKFMDNAKGGYVDVKGFHLLQKVFENLLIQIEQKVSVLGIRNKKTGRGILLAKKHDPTVKIIALDYAFLLDRSISMSNEVKK